MFLFGKERFLIFVKKNSLEFFAGKKTATLTIPLEVIKNLEVIDGAKYQKLIEDFISQQAFKRQDVLIVLSDEVIFHKEVPITGGDINEQSAQFLQIVPVAQENLVKKLIKTNNQIMMLATNKKIYSTIIEALSRSNWPVSAVVPIHLFSLEADLTDEIISKIFSSKNLLKAGNFLVSDVTRLDSSYTEVKSNRLSKTIPTLFLILALVGVLGSGIYFASKYFNLPLFSRPQVTQDQIDSTPSPEPLEESKEESSPSAQLVGKEELTVQILNGTGVVGLASEVRSDLTDLGFEQENIKIGNAEGAESEQTVVVFSEVVSDETKEEVITMLEESFTEVTTQDSSEADFEILITTGKQKVKD